MGISLKKGGNISLSKEGGTSLNKITVGLGWDERMTDGTEFDLDASVFCLNAFGRVRSDADFIFYNQPQLPDGSIVYGGDNKTGQGDGDDEQVFMTLNQVPADIQKVAICVSIYDSEARRQNFGMVANAFVRVVDDNTGRELARYDLSEDMSMETAMIFAEVYRHNNEWKFKAIGQGFSGGLERLARNFGVNV